MGRPRTIFIDSNELLRGIDAETKRQVSFCKKAIKANSGPGWSRDWQDAHSQLKLIEKYGIRSRVQDFVDRQLTASETLRAQKALRQLEAAGLIEISGTRASWVRLTPKGSDAVQAMLEAAKGKTNLPAAETSTP